MPPEIIHPEAIVFSTLCHRLEAAANKYSRNPQFKISPEILIGSADYRLLLNVVRQSQLTEPGKDFLEQHISYLNFAPEGFEGSRQPFWDLVGFVGINIPRLESGIFDHRGAKSFETKQILYGRFGLLIHPPQTPERDELQQRLARWGVAFQEQYGEPVDSLDNQLQAFKFPGELETLAALHNYGITQQ